MVWAVLIPIINREQRVRDVRDISTRDWVIYLGAALLLIGGVIVEAESNLKFDSWLLTITLSALLTFGVVIESQWKHRRNSIFWLILAFLFFTHFAVLLSFHPDVTPLWFAPISLLELLLVGLVLPRFGFPLILKATSPRMPLGRSRSLLIRGSVLIASSAALMAMTWALRSHVNARTLAGLIYVFFLAGTAGIGIAVVALGRWTINRGRREQYKD